MNLADLIDKNTQEQHIYIDLIKLVELLVGNKVGKFEIKEVSHGGVEEKS